MHVGTEPSFTGPQWHLRDLGSPTSMTARHACTSVRLRDLHIHSHESEAKFVGFDITFDLRLNEIR